MLTILNYNINLNFQIKQINNQDGSKKVEYNKVLHLDSVNKVWRNIKITNRSSTSARTKKSR